MKTFSALPNCAIAVRTPSPYADSMEAPSSPAAKLAPEAIPGTSNLVETSTAEKKPKPRWLLPVTVAATGLAGFAVLVTRGCWHRKMSWPLTVQGCSYRVCLGCGIKRLFDEPSFTSYGPYSYDLNKLTAWDQKRRLAAMPQAS